MSKLIFFLYFLTVFIQITQKRLNQFRNFFLATYMTPGPREGYIDIFSLIIFLEGSVNDFEIEKNDVELLG